MGDIEVIRWFIVHCNGISHLLSFLLNRSLSAMSMDKIKVLVVSYNNYFDAMKRSKDDRTSVLLYGHMKGIEEVLSLQNYVMVKAIDGRLIDIKERVI